jgi:hypothetical protein
LAHDRKRVAVETSNEAPIAAAYQHFPLVACHVDTSVRKRVEDGSLSIEFNRGYIGYSIVSIID